MLTLAILVARAMQRVTWAVVIRGNKTIWVDGPRWRATCETEGFDALRPNHDSGGVIDLYNDGTLTVWRQDFPGAEPTVQSDVFVGFYPYEEN